MKISLQNSDEHLVPTYWHAQKDHCLWGNEIKTQDFSETKYDWNKAYPALQVLWNNTQKLKSSYETYIPMKQNTDFIPNFTTKLTAFFTKSPTDAESLKVEE